MGLDMYLSKRTSETFKPTVIQFPSGKWGFVGSIPVELTTQGKNAIGQDIFPSKIYSTQEEAQTALNEYQATQKPVPKKITKTVQKKEKVVEKKVSEPSKLEQAIAEGGDFYYRASW